VSVAAQLGLPDHSAEPPLNSDQSWTSWAERFPCLARVGDPRSLRSWLTAAEPAKADEVLHALAILGSPSAGDDVTAATVLAWALLPGASALAHRLHTLSPRIDELVAAQLWVEIRSFPWQRLHKVAANILANTRAGVLRECEIRGQLERTDRAWSSTQLLDPSASFWNGYAAGLDPLPSAADELLELLDWACTARVLTKDDKKLLLSLVAAADRCGTQRTGRGSAGLMSNAASAAVARQVGLSPVTIRRRARRIIDALATVHHGIQAAA
jgi:hypothetical protein